MIFVQKALHSVSADQNRALGVALTAQWGKLVLGLLGENEFYLQKIKKVIFVQKALHSVCTVQNRAWWRIGGRIFDT